MDNNIDRNLNETPEQADQDRPIPTASASDGHSPTSSDQDGDTDGRGRTVAEHRHALTTNEALNRFEAAGLSRSQRSIERYCAHGKLDCIKDPDEGRHYITEASVERLIKYLKEIEARHMQPIAQTISDKIKQRNQEKESETNDQKNNENTHANTTLRARTERLQREVAFKDMYIEKLEEEREKDKERLVDLGRQVGELGHELRALAAPRGVNPRPDAGEDIEVDEIAGSDTLDEYGDNSDQ